MATDARLTGFGWIPWARGKRRESATTMRKLAGPGKSNAFVEGAGNCTLHRRHRAGIIAGPVLSRNT